MNNVMSLLTAP